MRRRRVSKSSDDDDENDENDKSESDQKKKTKKKRPAPGVGAAVNVVHVNSVVCLLVGFLLGAAMAGPWTADLVDWLRGYRWNYVDRCIMETPDTSGYGVDFCRVPVNCDVCRDVDHVEEWHVDEIDVDVFESRYAYSSRPLVVRNATFHWEAMRALDYYWLKDAYLSDPEILDKEWDDCWFNKYKTKEFRNLRSVFKLADHRVQEMTGDPWYVGWSVCHTPVAEALSGLYERPSFINPESTPPKKPWIFIGTPGYGAHSHVDNVDESSWQAQLRGVKTWTLTPPPECRWSCSGPLTVTLYPGDIIVLDTNKWFHATLVEGHDLSVVITNEYD